MPLRALDRLFRHDAAGGVLLMAAAIAAMLVANSAFQPAHDTFLNAVLTITLNGGGLQKPLLLWINDGLMAIFFFHIGLELKRELRQGKLKNPRDVLLPGMAALGGMAVPALVFVAINLGDPAALFGWAIPAATDIAFALGVLALVGSRAPAALKLFLLTLAILDDLGAILVIALFYTAELKLPYLVSALLPLAGLAWMNWRGQHRVAPIVLLGVVLWFLVLRSGVHATLAGVITAFFLPLSDRYGKSPLIAVEHALDPYVRFLILPLFAFANAGVILRGLTPADLTAALPLGIAAGLVVGKQLGVFGMTWLLVRAGFAHLPHGMGWGHVYGAACLAGIGFTMSLFIGGLSFDGPEPMNEVRLGVLAGSVVSALLGYAALMLASARAGRGRAALPGSGSGGVEAAGHRLGQGR